MTKKALIIDTALKHQGGHNFTYTRAVQTELEQCGYEVTVLANKNLIGELAQLPGYHAVFSLGTYDWPMGISKTRDLAYLYAQSVIFADELEQALRQFKVEEHALVFSHTLRDFELLGWNRYLKRNKFTTHLALMQRLTPNFDECPRWKTVAHPYWRIKPHTLNAMRKRLGERFVFVTDSELLSADFARVYRHPIITLPVPVHESFLRSEPLALNGFHARHGLTESRGLRVGYAGDDRRQRGFWLLPELVKRVLAEASAPVQFVIQCPNLANSNGSAAVAEMKQVAQGAGEQVKLIAERLSESDYEALVRCLDVILLPYSEPAYSRGTSGVFAEALALGKPVVVSSGTWMASELKKSGGGVEFERDDIDDLTAKALQLIERYDSYASKAQRYSEEWKRFHNPGSLVDMLLRACKLN